MTVPELNRRGGDGGTGSPKAELLKPRGLRAQVASGDRARKTPTISTFLFFHNSSQERGWYGFPNQNTDDERHTEASEESVA